MRVNCQTDLIFGRIYHGTKNKAPTRTQRDVIDDIDTLMEDKNYVQKLESLGYDVYMEPSDDKFSVRLAFLKNARYSQKGNFVFDKVVNICNFVVDIGARYRTVQNACSTEHLDNVMHNFFKNESWGKYKRYINYL